MDYSGNRANGGLGERETEGDEATKEENTTFQMRSGGSLSQGTGDRNRGKA